MKSAIMERPRKLVIREVPVPKCGPGEVLVRVRRATICNATDPEIYEGTFPFIEGCGGYPHAFGHECMGEVVETGAKVKGKKIRVGDRVAFWCKMSGAYSQYNAVPQVMAFAKLPDSVSDDAGALLELAGGGVARIADVAKIRRGEKVLVLGAGPGGLLLVQWAKILGAGRVAALEKHAMRRKLAERLGADFTFDPLRTTPAKALALLRKRFGEFDVVCDAFGDDRSPGAWCTELAIDALRPGGRYVVFSHPTVRRPMPLAKISSRGLAVLGAPQSMEESERILERAVKLAAQGRLKLDVLITHRVGLSGLEWGIRECMRHPERVVKIAVDPWKE